MAEVTPYTAKPRAKVETSAFDPAAAFNTTIEPPVALRDLATEGFAQSKEAYNKAKSAADDAVALLTDMYATAMKGGADYGRKLIEIGHANAESAFEFAGKLLAVHSLSEMIELAATYTRERFETLSEQSRQLSIIAEKVAMETAEPIRDGISRAAKKVA